MQFNFNKKLLILISKQRESHKIYREAFLGNARLRPSDCTLVLSFDLGKVHIVAETAFSLC